MADGAVTAFPGTHVWIAKGVLRSQWLLVAGTTTCLPVDAPHLPDKTLIVTGTWGSATLIAEGSVDNVDANYVAVNDSRGEGNPVSMTSNNTVTILENLPYIRAKTTGGTGTALTVTVVSQSTKR